MHYFSELVKQKDIYDFVFLPSKEAVITKTISSKKYSLNENEVSIKKHVLNQQILDIAGNKIVRVNDVLISDEPFPHILGVDTSFKALLRWFRLDGMYKHSDTFIPWSDIQLVEFSKGSIVVKEVREKLKRVLPEDLADHFEKISIRNSATLLSHLDPSHAATVMENLHISYQVRLFHHLPVSTISLILEHVSCDEAIDVLTELPKSKQDELLKSISEKKRAELHSLLRFSKSAIGKLLSSDFFCCDAHDTVANVYKKIRALPPTSSFHYIYVTNARNQLVGVFDMRELILQKDDTPVYAFMKTGLIVSHIQSPIVSVRTRMVKYKLSVIPVINDQKNILGVVTFDDII